MKRFARLLGIAALLAASSALPARTAGRFDQKLPVDRQAIHVLNRLTFGPRPGDIEQVRRLGIEKWIDLQLHPERIPENPVLDARLKPLVTLQLSAWQILDQYPAQAPAVSMRLPSAIALATLPQQQINRFNNCSAEDRISLLASFDTDTRRLVLAGANGTQLEGLPENIQREAATAHKLEQDQRQKEIHEAMPPLAELVTPAQMQIINRGTADEKIALIHSFDTDKRKKVMHAIPLGAVAQIPELRREAMASSQPQQFVNAELIENKLNRAIYSNHQLEEVLVDFWMNHFNIFSGKGQDRVLLTGFERDAIRPYVFGHFRDMLLATARHPAMLFYLDNWHSQVPRDDVPFPAGSRRPGLNENYGRELMELHTLGVDGGYTQQDVIAVARAFSGWTIYDPNKFAEFQFNPAVHDRKEKLILGHTIPEMGGENDAVQVIDILARHPSTAKFISKELAQRFVADDPPQSLVDRMANTFMKTDGDLRAVLQTMFASTEFLSEGAWNAKMKSPLEMTVSAVRAVNADVTDTYALAQKIADIGEPLYAKVEPTGYPNTGEGWTNNGATLRRINFATALTSGQIPGIAVDVSRFNFKSPEVVATEILQTPTTASMRDAIRKGLEGREATPSALAALILGSPEFQRR